MNWLKALKLVGGSVIDKPLEIIDKQLKFYQERKNAAHDQKLKQEESQFMQKLELDNRKLNAEIDDMIAHNETERDLQRAKAFTEAWENHKRTMAECNVSIGRSLGMMDIELRAHAVTLVEEKTRSYRDLQEETLNRAYEHFDKINAKFPEGSRARTIMEDAVAKQINSIIETSDKFLQTLSDDFEDMLKSVRQITESTVKNTEQYLSPIFANNALRGNDTKLLK